MTDRTLNRFTQIARLLAEEQRSWESQVWLRLAAAAAALAAGTPEEIAVAIRAAADELREGHGWRDALASRARLVFAAQLVAARHAVAPFLDQVRHCRRWLENVGFDGRTPHALLAIMILHLEDIGPITPTRIGVIRAIHDLMKRKHWWITSEDDLPICTLLSARHGTPEDVVAHVESIYSGLRQGGFSAGHHLQAAASLLTLRDLEPPTVCDAFRRLAYEAERRFLPIGSRRYESLALLTLLDGSVGQAMDDVERTQDGLKRWDRGMDADLVFALAADLTVLDRIATAVEGTRDRASLRTLQAVATVVVLNAYVRTGLPGLVLGGAGL